MFTLPESTQKPASHRCICCSSALGAVERMEVATEWQHRLDGYCYACASMRCDAAPDAHEREPQPKLAWIHRVNERLAKPGQPDDIEALRERILRDAPPPSDTWRSPPFWHAYAETEEALAVLTKMACPLPCVGVVNETGWHLECEAKAKNALAVLRGGISAPSLEDTR